LPKSAAPPPEFFVDRSLGNRIVPEAIRALGFRVWAMSDIYPNETDEGVADVDWIERAGRENWVVLTKDERITRRPDEVEALEASGVRVFAIGNQHLTGPQMAGYYTANIHRIVQRARKAGPFVDIVHPKTVERRWPK